MRPPLETRIADWDGLAVVSRYDRETDSWIFVCLHDDTLGRCAGGTRMKHYPKLAEALLDAQRLAEGMTHKWAAVGLQWGGGKCVIATPPELDPGARSGLLRRYGQLLKSLRGAFSTGEDLGTTSEDMQSIAAEAPFVHGFDPATGEKMDPSPYTAHAVYHGIRAAASEVLGWNTLAGRRVLLQGIGHVGDHLARQLAADGAEILVSDLHAERCRRAVESYGAEVIAPERIHDIECDIYAPCAVGATLDAETIPRLTCKIVAGSANNQLATPDDGERLHERGIVYVPDYIINAGGAVSFALLPEVGQGETLMQRVATIGETVGEILAEARDANESPVHAARRRVERNLARAKSA